MDDQSTTDSTTLADDEIFSVQDEEAEPTGDDADGDDTDTTRWRRRRRGRHRRGRRIALRRCSARSRPSTRSASSRSTGRRQPLVVPRAEEGRFDDLLSVRDVERLITETALRTPGVPARQGRRDGVGLHDRPLLAARRRSPASPTSRGCSPSSRRARRSSSRASTTPGSRSRATAGELEAFLGHPAQANAYFTPRGSQGLPVHHDTHEVFSLQVAGEKRWLVYEPALELPLKDQRYQLGARRARRAGARRHARSRRHALPAAGLAAPGAHLELRLAARDGRGQRTSLDRRGPRADRRRPPTTSSCAARSIVASRPSCRRSTRRRPSGAHGSASCARAGRSSTASSPSCARSTR